MRMSRNTPLIDSLEPRRLCATLAAGDTYPTNISGSGVQKNWSINLTAGQSIVVAAGETASGPLQTELILIAPTGKAIARSVGDKGSFIGKVAPVTGTYRVRVRDLGRNDTGGVRVTAFFTGGTVADSDDAGTIESGRRRASNISPGDLDVWTIPATAGQYLSAVATENDVGAALGMGVLLIGPNGRGVASKESPTGVAIDQPAAQAGTYYAVVYEAGADASGLYGISFARTPGVQYNGDPDTQTPLSSGVARTGDLPGGDTDVFQVSVPANRGVSVTLKGTTGSLDPELLIIDPLGNVVTRANSSNSATAVVNFTATRAGTYSILARDRESDDGGRFTLTYTLK